MSELSEVRESTRRPYGLWTENPGCVPWPSLP